MNFIDGVFERRAQAEYVDPQVSVDEACTEIRKQIPVTLEALRQNGFPAHQYSKSPAETIDFKGARHKAWVLTIGVGVPVAGAETSTGNKANVKKPARRVTSTQQPRKTIAVYIEGNDPRSLQLKLLYCANTVEYDYTEIVDIRRFSPPQAWAVLKLLKALAEPAKLMPWERPSDRW